MPETKSITAQHHYGAPLLFTVHTEQQLGDNEKYLRVHLVIQAPGVLANLNPISELRCEWDGYDQRYYSDDGEPIANAYTLVRRLYSGEHEHEVNRREIRLAAGLMEIACRPHVCFRLADQMAEFEPRFGGGMRSEFQRCVITASVALSCTDQTYVRETFEFYNPNEKEA